MTDKHIDECERLTTAMRKHVASYKELSRHRQQCLDLCDLVDALPALLRWYKETRLVAGSSGLRESLAEDVEKTLAALPEYVRWREEARELLK